MTAIKLDCCFIGCQATATYGFWTPPNPYDVNYACDDHLGRVLGDLSRNNNAEVWELVSGYDPTSCSADELHAVGAIA